jgi:threonine dehydrogenase-like Zn-dependent dehydrogenase
MPGIPKGIDWTPIWHKELAVSGSYAYGAETHRGAKIRTFELALRHLAEHGEKVNPLIGRKYRLEEYPEALSNALRGTGPIKSVFEIS